MRSSSEGMVLKGSGSHCVSGGQRRYKSTAGHGADRGCQGCPSTTDDQMPKTTSPVSHTTPALPALQASTQARVWMSCKSSNVSRLTVCWRTSGCCLAASSTSGQARWSANRVARVDFPEHSVPVSTMRRNFWEVAGLSNEVKGCQSRIGKVQTCSTAPWAATRAVVLARARTFRCAAGRGP